MTKIPWCDVSWNPVTGCTPVGEGCLNCYAKRQAERLQCMGVPKYRNGFKVTCHPEALNDPVLRKRKPQRIFVCSMGDLFHEKVLWGFVGSVLDVIWRHPRHTFIILTKRIQRALDFPGTGSLPDNLWLGVSVSTQRVANELLPPLRKCPAAKRIVSYEPALGPVDFTSWLPVWRELCEYRAACSPDGFCDGGCTTEADECDDHKECMRDGIDWLICGCESGPKRRHFDEDWARAARDACQESGVPFFYKQGRDWNGRVVKMPLLDGRRWEEYPC